MDLAKILLVLLAFMHPSMPTGNPPVTDADVARLSGLLDDLASRYGDMNDQITTNQVTIRSVEATLNRLVSDNAQLKASVSLLEESASQKAQLQDISQRLAAMEASNLKHGEPDTPCSLPFTEVFGRCVYADSSKSGTWEDMRQHCRTMDSDLVIKSADFMWHLIRHLREIGQDRNSYWVGGHRRTLTAPFQWVDGSPMKMGTPFWGYWNDYKIQQPYDGQNELHVCMYDKGLFFFHSCKSSYAKPPICQRR